MAKKCDLSMSQRREAVLAVLRKDEPLAVVARESRARWMRVPMHLGIAASSWYRVRPTRVQSI